MIGENTGIISGCYFRRATYLPERFRVKEALFERAFAADVSIRWGLPTTREQRKTGFGPAKKYQMV